MLFNTIIGNNGGEVSSVLAFLSSSNFSDDEQTIYLPSNLQGKSNYLVMLYSANYQQDYVVDCVIALLYTSSQAWIAFHDLEGITAFDDNDFTFSKTSNSLTVTGTRGICFDRSKGYLCVGW